MTNHDFQMILEAVSGSYDDFISYLVRNVTEAADRQKIIAYIRDNPNAGSDSVLEFYDEYLWCEEDDYDEDTIFYDDEDAQSLLPAKQPSTSKACSIFIGHSGFI